MIPEQQIKQIKEQIISQIKTWQAEESQKQEAISQINAMSANQLEEFLIKNKMIRDEKHEAKTGSDKETCIFCEIAKASVPSYKIDENKTSIAILEINPLSKAHTIIIPKKHIQQSKIPNSSFSLAKKIAKKIQNKFKPEKVDISASEAFGHSIINLIPHYKDIKLEKKKADEKELKEIQKKLEKKKKIKKEKLLSEKEKAEKLIEKIKKLQKFPIRMP